MVVVKDIEEALAPWIEASFRMEVAMNLFLLSWLGVSFAEIIVLSPVLYPLEVVEHAWDLLELDYYEAGADALHHEW